MQGGVVYSNKVIIMSSVHTKGHIISALGQGLEPTLAIHKYVLLFKIMNNWFLHLKLYNITSQIIIMLPILSIFIDYSRVKFYWCKSSQAPMCVFLIKVIFWFGCREKLVISPSGFDNMTWDPSRDNFLPQHYSADDMEGKLICKFALQRHLGLEEGASNILVSFSLSGTEVQVELHELALVVFLTSSTVHLWQ